MTADVAERVAAGMELQDKLDPGWWRADVPNAIDLDRLTIRRSHDCVLGQRHGSYQRGLKALRLATAVDADGISKAAEGFGFALALAGSPDGTTRASDELAALDAAWVKAITGRRAAA